MAEADKDPPPRLFPKRLKGYYKVPVLSRATILKGLSWVGRRGEFMTQWKNSDTGEDYDGSIIFAHAMDIFYLAHMEPVCSVNFQDPGYIESTSEVLKKIRKFVPCLLVLYMCVRVMTYLLDYVHAGPSGRIVFLCVVVITTWSNRNTRTRNTWFRPGNLYTIMCTNKKRVLRWVTLVLNPKPWP